MKRNTAGASYLPRDSSARLVDNGDHGTVYLHSKLTLNFFSLAKEMLIFIYLPTFYPRPNSGNSSFVAHKYLNLKLFNTKKMLNLRFQTVTHREPLNKLCMGQG